MDESIKRTPRQTIRRVQPSPSVVSTLKRNVLAAKVVRDIGHEPSEVQSILKLMIEREEESRAYRAGLSHATLSRPKAPPHRRRSSINKENLQTVMKALNESNKNNQDKDDVIGQLEAENRELRLKNFNVQELEAEINNLKYLLSSDREQQQEILPPKKDEMIDRLSRDVVNKKTEIDSLIESKRNKEEEVETLKNTIEVMKDELTSNEKLNNSLFEAAERRIIELENLLNEKDNIIEQIEREQINISTDKRIIELENLLNEKHNIIEQMQRESLQTSPTSSTNRQRRHSSVGLGNDTERLKLEILNLRDATKLYEKKIETLNSDYSRVMLEKDNIIKSLEIEREDNLHQLSDLAMKVEALLTGEKHIMNKSHEKLTNLIETGQDKLNERDEIIDALRESILEIESRNEALMNEGSEYVKKLENDKEDLNNNLKTRDNEIKRLRVYISDLEKKIGSSEEIYFKTIDELKTQIKVLEKQTLRKSIESKDDGVYENNISSPVNRKISIKKDEGLKDTYDKKLMNVERTYMKALEEKDRIIYELRHQSFQIVNNEENMISLGKPSLSPEKRTNSKPSNRSVILTTNNEDTNVQQSLIQNKPSSRRGSIIDREDINENIILNTTSGSDNIQQDNVYNIQKNIPTPIGISKLISILKATKQYSKAGNVFIFLLLIPIYIILKFIFLCVWLPQCIVFHSTSSYIETMKAKERYKAYIIGHCNDALSVYTLPWYHYIDIIAYVIKGYCFEYFTLQRGGNRVVSDYIDMKLFSFFEEGYTQVVLIGGEGRDCRFHRLKYETDLYEVDTIESLQYQRKTLPPALINPSVKYLTTFNDTSLWLEDINLVRLGFNKNKKTLIIITGANHMTETNFRDHLISVSQCVNGSKVIFDYFESEYKESLALWKSSIILTMSQYIFGQSLVLSYSNLLSIFHDAKLQIEDRINVNDESFDVKRKDITKIHITENPIQNHFIITAIMSSSKKNTHNKNK